jgi:hypothetical protein
MSIGRGHAAPLVRIFNSEQSLVYEGVTRFSYVFSEKADDASFISIETNDVNLVDHPDLQDGKQLIVVWGYIGAFEYQKRILYIWDLKTSFNDQGVRIEIECYCKAAFMKLNSSKDVFTSETVDELGQEMADAYGLDYETRGVKTDEKPSESQFNVIHTGGKTEAQLDFTRTNPGATIARDNTAVPREHVFKKYAEGIPQANKTDKKLLDDYAALEPTDNMFFDTRDDKLILTRRNFLQIPYKAYTWKAEPGHLLAFTPASKNVENKKFGVANSVSGWLDEDKEYIQGEVNRSHSGAGVLGDIIEMSLEERVKKKVEEGIYNPLDRPASVDGLAQLETKGVDDQGNPITRVVIKEKIDSTQAVVALWHKQGTQPSRLVFNQRKQPFYSAAIDNTGRIETRGVSIFEPKEYLPLVENKPAEIAGAGINRQSEKELDLNEHQAEILGDPTLIVGKVITIIGVGKRYSGNYYIFHCNHEISPEKGYVCYLKLYRTGTGKLGKEEANKIDASELGLLKNLRVANPNDGTPKLIDIPIKNDSDFTN